MLQTIKTEVPHKIVQRFHFALSGTGIQTMLECSVKSMGTPFDRTLKNTVSIHKTSKNFENRHFKVNKFGLSSHSKA